MNVLLVTPQPPYPPVQGAALRNFAILRQLARRHAVHLLSFGEAAAEARAALSQSCQHIRLVPAPSRTPGDRLRTLLTTSLPDLATRLATPAFHQALADLLARMAFDVIQFEGIELAPYLLALPKGAGSVLILDEHNAEYLLQRRMFAIDRRDPRRLVGALYSAIQWRRLIGYERAACQHADVVLAVSTVDRQALLALDPTLDVRVVPNGVDASAFSPSDWSPRSPVSRSPCLVFTGTMDYRPNVDAVVWFCAEVLPRIVRAVPTARFVIVGRNPAPAVRRLRSAHVVVTGAVPDERPYLADAAVYVVPIRIGGGMRFKILQAMAAGIPVVTTRIGAEGTEVRDGVHCAIADDAARFADAVIRILREPAYGQALAAAARRYVAERFDWPVVLAPLEDLYQEIERSGLPGRRVSTVVR